MSANELVVDACVLINVYGSGRVEEVVEANGVELLAAEEAAAEGLYVEREGQQEPIDVAALVAEKTLLIVTVTGPEVATMVDYASEVDEGEAATLAIATHRRIPVATDDRGALRFISRRTLGLTVVRTSDLMLKWARGRTREEIGVVLRRIESDARFRPGATDPNKAWWDQSSAD